MKTRLHPVEGGGEVPLLEASVLGAPFAHGFTTRAGGVSPPPFDSLNLGGRWGDRPEHVRENRRRLQAALGARALAFVAQVHGAAVVRVRAEDDLSAVAAREADAVVTDVPGLAVGVFVADCVPVLLADPRTGACGAVHAGWRGVVAGAVSAALSALGAEFGTRADDVRVAIGPSIGPCCFEVGDEVAAAFRQAWPAEAGVVIAAPGRKPHVDLRRALALELARAGVAPAAIDSADGACTRCQPDRFFSYRRDVRSTGQQVGAIVRR